MPLSCPYRHLTVAVFDVLLLIDAFSGDSPGQSVSEEPSVQEGGRPKEDGSVLYEHDNRSRTEGRIGGRAESVLNLMDTMIWDMETTMNTLKIDEADRPAIRKLVEDQLKGVSA